MRMIRRRQCILCQPKVTDEIQFVNARVVSCRWVNMVRPLNFKTEYVLTQSVPYECADEGTKGTNASKGILQTGRVVWLDSGAIGSETGSAFFW